MMQLLGQFRSPAPRAAGVRESAGRRLGDGLRGRSPVSLTVARGTPDLRANPQWCKLACHGRTSTA